ncbi:hypothetical protein GCM10010486_17670 [Nonomuraea roseoviolacea subsp. carminata]
MDTEYIGISTEKIGQTICGNPGGDRREFLDPEATLVGPCHVARNRDAEPYHVLNDLAFNTVQKGDQISTPELPIAGGAREYRVLDKGTSLQQETVSHRGGDPKQGDSELGFRRWIDLWDVLCHA